MNKWKREFMCEFYEPEEIEELTTNEANRKFNINIDRGSLEKNRGINFSYIAIRLTKCGDYRIASYMPTPYGVKKYDVIVKII